MPSPITLLNHFSGDGDGGGSGGGHGRTPYTTVVVEVTTELTPSNDVPSSVALTSSTAPSYIKNDGDGGGGGGGGGGEEQIVASGGSLAVIVILSVLVVAGIVFTVCRLLLKAEAHRKCGLGRHQDSLLYCEKASKIIVAFQPDVDRPR